MASDPNFASRLALLPFDGSIVDKKGAVWTAVGGTQTYVTGVYASTQSLGGSPAASRVQAPATTQANFGTANVAFEFWFKGTAAALKAPYIIFSSEPVTADKGIRLMIYADSAAPVADAGTLQFDAPQIAVSNKRTSGFNLCDGAWHFVQVIRSGTNFTMRVGNVGDSSTLPYFTDVVIGSFSAAGFVAPSIGQEPALTTYSPLEGLQAFRITTGTPVSTLPTLVPTAQWPDGPVATVTGLAATWARGTVVGRGTGKGFTSGKQAAYTLGAQVATGGASTGVTGQSGAYSLGAVAAGVAASAAVAGVAALWTQGVATASQGSQAGTATPAGASGAWGSGVAAALGAGVAGAGSAAGAYARGAPAAAGSGSAAAPSVSGVWSGGAATATGAAGAAAGSAAAAYANGAFGAAGSASTSALGTAGVWASGELAGAAGGAVSVLGFGAAYALGAIHANVSAGVSVVGVAAMWAQGDATASTPLAPSRWIFWSEPAESRILVVEHEDRRAVIAGESREYRLTK